MNAVLNLKRHQLAEVQLREVRIPPTLRCPDPNITSMLEDALEAYQRFGAECERDKTYAEYGDEPDTRKLFARIAAMEEMLEASMEVQLALSRSNVEAALKANGSLEAVNAWCRAVEGAK